MFEKQALEVKQLKPLNWLTSEFVQLSAYFHLYSNFPIQPRSPTMRIFHYEWNQLMILHWKKNFNLPDLQPSSQYHLQASSADKLVSQSP